jgi:ubiquinone/menaquinone biosynthesis C-methylase UbiE
MACSNCGKSQLSFYMQCYGFDDSKERFDLFRCNDCGLVATYPLMSPKQLSVYYHSDYYGGANDKKKTEAKFHPWIETLVKLASASRSRKAIRYLDKQSGIQSGIQSTAPRKYQFLDVGCGRGTFINSLAREGHSCVGTEIAEFQCDPQANVKILRGTLEELQLPSSSFDGVWIWHVLEHTTDPQSSICEIARVLKPGGVVAIAVPHFGSWQRSLFGRHWFHLDLPRHQYHFTIPVLLKILKENQLEPISIRTLSWEQNIFGGIQSFQNWLFFRRHPNGLYAILKRDRKLIPQSGLAKWFLPIVYLSLAVISLPFAFLETILSALFARGATLILHASRLGEDSRLP